MDSDSDSDSGDELDPPRAVQDSMEPKKRPNPQSVGDLRLTILSDSILEIFPEVHVPTLRQRISHMLHHGYPESSVVELLSDEIGECGGDFPQAQHVPDPPATVIHQSITFRENIADTAPNSNELIAKPLAAMAATTAQKDVGPSTSNAASKDTGPSTSAASTSSNDVGPSTSASTSASTANTSAIAQATTTEATATPATVVPASTPAPQSRVGRLLDGIDFTPKTLAKDPIVIPDNSPRGDGPIIISDDEPATDLGASNKNNNNYPAPTNNNNNNNTNALPIPDWNLTETAHGQGKGKGVGKGESNRRSQEPKATYESVIRARIKEFLPLVQHHFRKTLGEQEAVRILQHIFIGLRKSNLDIAFRRHARSLTLTVVKVVEALLQAHEPELLRLMLSRNPTAEIENERNTPHPIRTIEVNFDTGPCRINVMSGWRRSILAVRMLESRDFDAQEQAADLDQWLNAVFGVPEDFSLPFSPSNVGETSISTPKSPICSPSPSVPSPSPSRLSSPELGGIECQCCFGEFLFEDLVQCMEGHLFCRGCIQAYAQSAISGEGKSTLTCIAGECAERFPRAQLEACLEPKTMQLLEEREQEESVRLACGEEGNETLAQCPNCRYKCYLPPGNKVIECQNPDCMKATCIQCNGDWADHCGIPCHEFESKDEESLRVKAEEKMTAALLRVCHKCKTPLLKEEGCNKLTCRCGAKMCYICRTPIKDYSHFCNHPRSPGRGCNKCKSCSLWSNPKEDDERAMEEIRVAAEKEKEERGFVNDRKIGLAHSPNKAPAKAAAPGGALAGIAPLVQRPPAPNAGPALFQAPAPAGARAPAPRPGPAPRGGPQGGNN